MSSPGRKAGAPLSEPPAGDYFLQATAERRPLESMFGSADFRIGGGLTIRRSRRLDFAGIPRRDQGELASRPSDRGQVWSGGPAEVVRQRVRLFPCRDAGYPGTAQAQGGGRRTQSLDTSSGAGIRAGHSSLRTADPCRRPSAIQEATSSIACRRWII
jgi:hypothetical protein